MGWQDWRLGHLCILAQGVEGNGKDFSGGSKLARESSASPEFQQSS